MSKRHQKIPKIRFNNFNDNWYSKKADEVFISVSDKNHPNSPVLSATQDFGMVLRTDVGIDIKYDKKSLKSYKKVVPGQFVIHLRSFQGGFAHSTIEGITSPAYTIIDYKNAEEHEEDFWKEVFKSKEFIKRLETVTYGIRDGRSISYSDFSTLKFNYPITTEQKK